MLLADITTDTSYSTGATPDPWMPTSWQAGTEAGDWQCPTPKMRIFRRPARPQTAYSRPCLYLDSAMCFLAPFEARELSPGQAATNPNPRGAAGGAPIAEQNVKRRRCF